MIAKHKILKFPAIALIAFCASAISLAAWGGNIHIQDGTSHIFCKPQGNVTIDPDGNVFVPVETGCLPIVELDTPPTDTCGITPSNVVVVDTGSFSDNWKQQTVSPAPDDIFSYKVVVPAGVSAVNTFSTARTSAGLRAKLLVVSECPGSFEPVGGQSRCTAPNPQETSSVVLTTIQNKYRCNLSPGTYYVNAASRDSLNGTGYTCSNKTNCSVFVVRQRN